LAFERTKTAGEKHPLDTQRFWSAACGPILYAVSHLLLERRGHEVDELEELRARVWSWLDAHDGPVIWVANHLTQLDTWLVMDSIFSYRTSFRASRIPWSLPRTSLFFREGGGVHAKLLRLWMFLGRGIPIDREGDDAQAVASRERALRACVHVLRGRGSVFLFPEADLSPNGWLDRCRPRDFVGQLATEVPRAAVLCLYLRGETQSLSSLLPRKGERFRILADWISPDWRDSTSPRAISQMVFDRLATLQGQWFAQSALPRNCSGNDVIDLKSPPIENRFEADDAEIDAWLDKHLTPGERRALGNPARDPKARVRFWRMFAAKEAAFKALGQAGLQTPHMGYPLLETDLFLGKVVHLPSGANVAIRFTDDDGQKIHCIAVLRGGSIGDDDTPGDTLWRVERLPSGGDPSSFVREILLDFIAASSDDIRPGDLSMTSVEGIPKVLRAGRIQDWGVSLSHSGRFVACSFMIS
jgi:1-acyl-sn-glycerol-3-phosphate acyltransferase